MSARTPEERLDELDRVFSALAHRARRQILMTVYLRGGEMSAGDIAGRFAHAWPTTTRHLGVLESAGLLTSTRQGTSRIYRIEPTAQRAVVEWLAWFQPRRAEE